MGWDFTAIILGVVSLATTVLGWFARQLWDAVQSLRKDLTALQIVMSTDYVRYDRLQDALQPIITALQEIKETLKEKADK